MAKSEVKRLFGVGKRRKTEPPAPENKSIGQQFMKKEGKKAIFSNRTDVF